MDPTTCSPYLTRYYDLQYYGLGPLGPERNNLPIYALAGGVPSFGFYRTPATSRPVPCQGGPLARPGAPGQSQRS
ncbi:MAG: hypothetical protein AB1758_23240, partial [Candidatus Eremiobacterota bacterium]